MEQHSGFTPEPKLSVAVSVSAEATCLSMKTAVFQLHLDGSAHHEACAKKLCIA